MPKIDDLKLTTFTFDFAYKHLISDRTFKQKYFKHSQRIVRYIRLYQKHVQYYNQTAYNILQNEINLILPTLNEPNRKKRFLSAVLGTVASKSIGLDKQMKVLGIIDMFLFSVILFIYVGMSYCCINHQIYL